MFILKNLFTPLQEQFSDTKQGPKRKIWFAYTLLAVVITFTSSITSNLLRALQTLYGTGGHHAFSCAWTLQAACFGSNR